MLNLNIRIIKERKMKIIYEIKHQIHEIKRYYWLTVTTYPGESKIDIIADYLTSTFALILGEIIYRLHKKEIDKFAQEFAESWRKYDSCDADGEVLPAGAI